MTATPNPVASSVPQVEPKPHALTPADRGAALLAGYVDSAQQWGASAQTTLTQVLADLIAAAEQDADLSFADALAKAWRRLD